MLVSNWNHLNVELKSTADPIEFKYLLKENIISSYSFETECFGKCYSCDEQLNFISLICSIMSINLLTIMEIGLFGHLSVCPFCHLSVQLSILFQHYHWSMGSNLQKKIINLCTSRIKTWIVLKWQHKNTHLDDPSNSDKMP